MQAPQGHTTRLNTYGDLATIGKDERACIARCCHYRWTVVQVKATTPWNDRVFITDALDWRAPYRVSEAGMRRASYFRRVLHT
jgi:hypothetical protein